MKSGMLIPATAILLAGCAISHSNSRSPRTEPVETYVAIVERNSEERRSLSIAELESAHTYIDDSSAENRRQLDRIYGVRPMRLSRRLVSCD